MRKRRRRPPPAAPPAQPRINEKIRVPEVRLIDETGAQVGVVSTPDAIVMARERDVDLVEVSAKASPPVARLMDFGQFKYEQAKKDREAKKHQQKVQIREVRMKPKIDTHDIDFKTKIAKKLLRRGDKVKLTVMFRGREITHPQIGKNLLDQVYKDLEGMSILEKSASLEGRHMTMIIAPDKRKIAGIIREEAEKAEAEGVELSTDSTEVSEEEAPTITITEEESVSVESAGA